MIALGIVLLVAAIALRLPPACRVLGCWFLRRGAWLMARADALEEYEDAMARYRVRRVAEIPALKVRVQQEEAV